MSLSDEERNIIVSLELKKAHDTFEEIGILLEASRWSGAANRLYYAVFHAVSALLIHDGYQERPRYLAAGREFLFRNYLS